MAKVAPVVKKTELNPPKTFTGKRTDLRRFLQDTFVFLTINKEHYNNDDKKIAFVMSFMTDGDTALWKEEFIGKVIRDSVARGDNISFGTYKKFIESLKKLFSPYDAPGDTLNTMKHLRMGDGNFDEHLAKFKLLVSQSGLVKSPVIVDLFRETLPIGLQQPILLSENPLTTLQEWYDKASTFTETGKGPSICWAEEKPTSQRRTPQRERSHSQNGNETPMPWTSIGL